MIRIPPDKALVVDLTAGQAEAYAALYDRYDGPALLRVARTMTPLPGKCAGSGCGDGQGQGRRYFSAGGAGEEAAGVGESDIWQACKNFHTSGIWSLGIAA